MPEKYITEDDLNQIKSWKSEDDYHELMYFVQSIWYHGDYSEKIETSFDEGTEVTYSFSTGEWSGNEEIIKSLSANEMFWISCWYSSKRGGYFKFKIKVKERSDV